MQQFPGLLITCGQAVCEMWNWCDYKWLSQVFESVRPPVGNIGKLLWFTLGAQTTKLIHDSIHVGEVHQLDEFVMDADVIEDIFNNPDPKNAKCDAATQFSFSEFENLMNNVKPLWDFVNSDKT